ncbi:MAG: hypothetical protein HYW25_05430 [Candidatus Aenigmarchaeota archaeon]|nr:hypothetical protein [Candidatus Aenigmarchaeota archaeon]
MVAGAESEARPVSEYLYFYHKHRKNFKYLYYCKNCIINFDAKERAKNCEKCGGDNIVELPKETELKGKKKMGIRDMIEGVKTGIYNDKQQRAIFKGKPDVHLLRLKILFHYLTIPGKRI